jgi:hypothetical protein
LSVLSCGSARANVNLLLSDVTKTPREPMGRLSHRKITEPCRLRISAVKEAATVQQHISPHPPPEVTEVEKSK